MTQFVLDHQNLGRRENGSVMGQLENKVCLNVELVALFPLVAQSKIPSPHTTCLQISPLFS